MDHHDFEFDDPAMKRAVRDAWGDERAPQRLRGRISRLMATAGSIDDATVAASGAAAAAVRAERWRSRAYAFTAAAAVVLALGLAVLYYQGTFDPAVPAGRSARASVVPSRTDVPLTLARSMLATHTACGKLHDHHTVQEVDGNTYAALTVKLTADLGFPTLVRGIGPEWKFKGASACEVGGLRGAHLLFARGGQTVSVFSLPSSCMTGVPPGAQFEGTVDDHPIAGFARPGAVYAVIGSAEGSAEGLGQPPPLESVIAIRDTLLSVFEIGCAAHDPEGLLFFQQ